MIPSSACQPWPPDQPGQAGIVVALGSYTTIRDTTEIGVDQAAAGTLYGLKKLLPLDAFLARKAAENPGFVNAHVISIVLRTIVLCIRFCKNAVSLREASRPGGYRRDRGFSQMRAEMGNGFFDPRIVCLDDICR